MVNFSSFLRSIKIVGLSVDIIVTSYGSYLGIKVKFGFFITKFST